VDDATNNELNLDKPLEDWVFRVRFTQQELKALQEMTCAPHPAYLNNKEMMIEVEKILNLMEGVPKDNILLLDLPYQMLWALQGLVQNPAPVFFQRKDIQEAAESVFYASRSILDQARQTCFPPSEDLNHV
jgi:hypothetical protein